MKKALEANWLDMKKHHAAELEKLGNVADAACAALQQKHDVELELVQVTLQQKHDVELEQVQATFKEKLQASSGFIGRVQELEKAFSTLAKKRSA